jgi:hypothetical protein
VVKLKENYKKFEESKQKIEGEYKGKEKDNTDGLSDYLTKGLKPVIEGEVIKEIERGLENIESKSHNKEEMSEAKQNIADLKSGNKKLKGDGKVIKKIESDINDYVGKEEIFLLNKFEISKKYWGDLYKAVEGGKDQQAIESLSDSLSINFGKDKSFDKKIIDNIDGYKDSLAENEGVEKDYEKKALDLLDITDRSEFAEKFAQDDSSLKNDVLRNEAVDKYYGLANQIREIDFTNIDSINDGVANLSSVDLTEEGKETVENWMKEKALDAFAVKDFSDADDINANLIGLEGLKGVGWTNEVEFHLNVDNRKLGILENVEQGIIGDIKKDNVLEV